MEGEAKVGSNKGATNIVNHKFLAPCFLVYDKVFNLSYCNRLMNSKTNFSMLIRYLEACDQI